MPTKIKEKIREDDPKRYNRVLGRLAEGILKEGTLKESTLRKGKGDERQAKDIEVRKKIKQKEDRKEERREDIKKKAEQKHITNRSLQARDVSQGEVMDTSRATWTCEKCKTVNEESYKFCMECAERNPKRSIEEVASGSSEPPAYRQRREEGGSCLQKEEGETRGDIDKTMDVDMMEEEEFQERKKDLRENKVPLVILKGGNWRRAAQLGEVQNMGGEYYVWEMPRKMNNAVINKKMRNIGGPGVIVKDTKIWTNSDRVKERIDEELRKRKTVLHSEGIRWADDEEAKTEEYKLGRAVGEAIREELVERESEDVCLIEEESAKPGILYIEDG